MLRNHRTRHMHVFDFFVGCKNKKKSMKNHNCNGVSNCSTIPKPHNECMLR